MSTRPSDKQRARQKNEHPWYLRPIVWKTIVLTAKVLAWIYDHT